MSERLEINLTTVVPPNAVAATLQYKTTASAKALLHRFDGDQSPIVLNGPSGDIEVNLSQTRTLYLERLDGADWEIGCSGYRF